MTWEETIKFIRTQPEYKELVELAYFEEKLELNLDRFTASEEFLETIRFINTYKRIDTSVKLLDIGSGNGISALAFAKKGMQVDAVEPDPSDTIGAGAIVALKERYQLLNLNVHQAYAESLKFQENSFDIVYARQCMHHANDLQQFLMECARVLKKGGLLFTVRDHVIYNEKDKKWFLEMHPLQKFYGGENAYLAEEYKTAMRKAGFEIKQELKHFESVINHFPLSSIEKKRKENARVQEIDLKAKNKLGFLSKIGVVNKVVKNYLQNKMPAVHDESRVPGRLYSYLAIKN